MEGFLIPDSGCQLPRPTVLLEMLRSASECKSLENQGRLLPPSSAIEMRRSLLLDQGLGLLTRSSVELEILLLQPRCAQRKPQGELADLSPGLS